MNKSEEELTALVKRTARERADHANLSTLMSPRQLMANELLCLMQIN
jgi:hypothetical protein